MPPPLRAAWLCSQRDLTAVSLDTPETSIAPPSCEEWMAAYLLRACEEENTRKGKDQFQTGVKMHGWGQVLHRKPYMGRAVREHSVRNLQRGVRYRDTPTLAPLF